MGLYLCIFDDEDEVEGVEVGSYSDFEFFRKTVTEVLEDGVPGSKFPTLINHSDCDGEWTASECRNLKRELMAISRGFQQLPSIPYNAEWQRIVADTIGLRPLCLCDSFIDVDGESLIERLSQLCDIAIERQKAIAFQ